MSNVTTRCFRVRGIVQGVAFRASTRYQANLLELGGYAKNLPDGSVEVVVCGDSDKIERLREWLWKGPPHARVEEVEESISPDTTYHSFLIL